MSRPEEELESPEDRRLREEREALELEVERAKADEWNSKYLPGVRVCAVLRDGKAFPTQTRSEAILKDGKAEARVAYMHEWVPVDRLTALEYNPRAIIKILYAIRTEYSSEETKGIRQLTEDEYVEENLSTFGMRVYTKLVHHAEDRSVENWFFKEGIKIPLAMGAILLRAFHRELTLKPIDLPGLVAMYKKIQADAEA